MRRRIQRLAVKARAVRAAAAWALFVAAGAGAQAEPGVDEARIGFVHVEANVGGASGGHTALLLGDRVYHYQLGEGRLLTLRREDWGRFRFVYGVLQNRPLHVAEVAVAPAALRRVREGFDEVFLEQQREHARIEALRRDAALLEALHGQRPGVPTRGAGLLDPEQPAPRSARALAQRVDGRLTPGLVDQRLGALDAALGEPPERAEELEPWREDLALRAALRALRRGDPLAEDAIRPVRGGPLTPTERRALHALAGALEERLVRLLGSPRPDVALPLFATLARHRAARRSLEEGRLFLVDPLPDGAPRLDARTVAARREELAAVADGLQDRLERARRAHLAGRAPDDRQLGVLEALASRTDEYRRGAEETRLVREAEGALVPERGRELAAGASAASGTASLLAEVREVLGEAEQRRASRWRYDLFEANCVTALVDTLHGALGGEGEGARILGGALPKGEPLAFWPLVFFRKLNHRLAVVELRHLPSHRTRALEALPRSGPPGLVRAREGNTLTSRVYARRDADGSFLLFTDGFVWTRPLSGAINLAWSVGDGALGLLTAPLDRGARLLRAGRGALFSLPELVFVNIRKGSFDAATLRQGALPAR